MHQKEQKSATSWREGRSSPYEADEMQEATAKRLCDRLHYSFGCAYAAAVEIPSLDAVAKCLQARPVGTNNAPRERWEARVSGT